MRRFIQFLGSVFVNTADPADLVPDTSSIPDDDGEDSSESSSEEKETFVIASVLYTDDAGDRVRPREEIEPEAAAEDLGERPAKQQALDQEDALAAIVPILEEPRRVELAEEDPSTGSAACHVRKCLVPHGVILQANLSPCPVPSRQLARNVRRR